MMRPRTHRRQGPFCGACTTYKKPSTFDKYVTKFLGTANPIPNFEFADKYVKSNKQIKYFKFFSGHIGSHIWFVSHSRFKFDEITKPFKYLYYVWSDMPQTIFDLFIVLHIFVCKLKVWDRICSAKKFGHIHIKCGRFFVCFVSPTKGSLSLVPHSCKYATRKFSKNWCH